MTDLFLGFDVGGTDVKSGVVNEAGQILRENKFATMPEQGPDMFLKRIKKEIDNFRNEFDISGIGIGMPGLVDNKNGFYKFGPNLPGFKNIKMVEILEKLSGLPVNLDNDANMAALGEFSYGAARNFNSGMLITLGTGVGSGLILGKEVFHGVSGAAGEFGHTIIKFDGPVCSCGRQGCIEAFAGTAGILRILQEKIEAGEDSELKDLSSQERTPKSIYDAAKRGDSVAAAVFADVGMYLGIAMANTSNLLNIECFVIGGGVAGAWDFIVKSLKYSFMQHALGPNAEGVEIFPAELSNKAGLIGAAESVKRKIQNI
ncbi:hypothetical protein DRQ07_03970 [candidate division KSB1 bacterium]|nr:MAG: hypothetical protein DRQ07_03970 [candidate division KSB1 bacterium]